MFSRSHSTAFQPYFFVLPSLSPFSDFSMSLCGCHVSLFALIISDSTSLSLTSLPVLLFVLSMLVLRSTSFYKLFYQFLPWYGHIACYNYLSFLLHFLKTLWSSYTKSKKHSFLIMNLTNLPSSARLLFISLHTIWFYRDESRVNIFYLIPVV